MFEMPQGKEMVMPGEDANIQFSVRKPMVGWLGGGGEGGRGFWLFRLVVDTHNGWARKFGLVVCIECSMNNFGFSRRFFQLNHIVQTSSKPTTHHHTPIIHTIFTKPPAQSHHSTTNHIPLYHSHTSHHPPHQVMEQGIRFTMRDGGVTLGYGVVTKVLGDVDIEKIDEERKREKKAKLKEQAKNNA